MRAAGWIPQIHGDWGCVCVCVCVHVDGVRVVGREGLSMSPSALWIQFGHLDLEEGKAPAASGSRAKKMVSRRWRTRVWEGVVSRL